LQEEALKAQTALEQKKQKETSRYSSVQEEAAMTFARAMQAKSSGKKDDTGSFRISQPRNSSSEQARQAQQDAIFEEQKRQMDNFYEKRASATTTNTDAFNWSTKANIPNSNKSNTGDFNWNPFAKQDVQKTNEINWGFSNTSNPSVAWNNNAFSSNYAKNEQNQTEQMDWTFPKAQQQNTEKAA